MRFSLLTAFFAVVVASLATAQENTLRIKEVEQLTGHSTQRGVAVHGMALSRDGGRAAYVPRWEGGGRTGTHPPVVWDLANGRLIGRLKGRGGEGSFDLAMSLSGDRIASEGQSGLYWWDIRTGAGAKLIDSRTKFTVSGLHFSHNEKMLASSHTSLQLFVWDLSTGKQLHALDGAGGVTRFSSDDSQLASATPDLEVKIWNLQQKGFPERLKFDPGIPRQAQVKGIRGMVKVRARVRAMEFYSDDSIIHALAGLSGAPFHYQRWDVESGKSVHTGTVGRRPTCATLLPDGRTAILGDADGSVELWNLEKGKMISGSRSHSKQVAGIAVSQDGKRVLTGGYDLKVVFHELKSN